MSETEGIKALLDNLVYFILFSAMAAMFLIVAHAEILGSSLLLNLCVCVCVCVWV